MSTLRINNIEAKSVPASPTIDEKIKLTNSSGDVLVHVDGKTSGITTIGINTTAGNIKFDQNSNVVVTGIITATKFVGTIEPTELTVNGTSEYPVKISKSDSTAAYLQFINSTTGSSTSDGFRIGMDSNEDGLVWLREDGNVKFGTNNSERLRITSAGAVNIGDVPNNTWIDSTLKVRKDQNAVTKIAVRNENQGSSASAAIVVNSYGNSWMFDCGSNAKNSNALTIRVDATASSNQGTEKLRITTAGRVGINETSPDRDLHISNTTPYIRVESTSANQSATLELYHTRSNGSDKWPSSVASVDGGLTLNVANGSNGAPQEKLRITSDGKMGLGIASPTGQFAVSDGTRIAEINPHSSGTFIGNRSNHDVLFQVNAATKAKIDTNGHLTITDGNLVVANGHGIDFSATYDGSNVSGVTATSELLDDYEEGTFQPLLKRLMANNYTETNFYNQGTRLGNYTRIGDRVWITGAIYWNGGSTGSGSVILTNLPFTVNSGTANEVPLVIGYRSGWNYRDMTGNAAGNMNRFYIAYYDSNGTYNIAPSATSSQGTIFFSANYELV